MKNKGFSLQAMTHQSLNGLSRRFFEPDQIITQGNAWKTCIKIKEVVFNIMVLFLN